MFSEFNNTEYYNYYSLSIFCIINAQEPETEAVSDEELPVAAPADLGETESVSEDELPPDSDKKRKGAKLSKTLEKKIKAESGSEYYFCSNIS